MEKIRWTDHVRNEEVLLTVKEQRNILHEIMKRKANWVCYILVIVLYGAETWMLRAVDQKQLESFEMWCWRRMEKISLTDHVRNEEVLGSRSTGISCMK